MLKGCFFGICILVQSLLHADWESYKNRTLTLLPKFEGWCTKEKAEDMMDLILEVKPEICVEVGVFGGSSLFPTARALLYNRVGIVYAIDPWINKECLANLHPDTPDYKWWKSVDLNKILFQFQQNMSLFGINKYCKILRLTSEEAVNKFKDESIDILHINRIHLAETISDIMLYFPKLKKGGFVWVSNLNWIILNCLHPQLLSYYEVEDKTLFKDDFILLKKIDEPTL